MGSKTVARRTVRDAGAPVVPGTVEPVSDPEEGRRVAAEIGYPVMLKASAGGGGKGMRLVSPEELIAALESAGIRSDARPSATTRSTSRRRSSSRDISRFRFSPTSTATTSISANANARCSAGTRRSSRNAHRPFNDADLRRADGRSGRDGREGGELRGRRHGRVSRSTPIDFYFLEMNTRLQVEHPVTELVTGHRSRPRADPRRRRRTPLVHAGRCHVARSRDRSAASMPKIRSPASSVARPHHPVARARRTWHPRGRRRLRGWEVAIHYDPLLAKLAVWAETRDEAIARLRRALAEYAVGGIKTTLPLFRALCADENVPCG